MEDRLSWVRTERPRIGSPESIYNWRPSWKAGIGDQDTTNFQFTINVMNSAFYVLDVENITQAHTEFATFGSYLTSRKAKEVAEAFLIDWEAGLYEFRPAMALPPEKPDLTLHEIMTGGVA